MEVQFSINNIFETVGTPCTYENLTNYFKSNYYGKIFVKKFNEELILVSNTFDSKTNNSSDLYNECRSLVIKLGTNPRVISYTHDNIDYLKISEHKPEPEDLYEESFEGTLVSVFCYEGTWHFTTSRCTSIDQSYFYDKTKSFGTLFDECLSRMGLASRDEFVQRLNPLTCYYFVIVHHANKYVVDYTERFGANYTKLVHIFSREQSTQQIIESSDQLEGLVYPQKFENYQQGLEWIMGTNQTEGLVVKRFNEQTRKTKLFKIHSDKYWLAKSHNPNYPNRWFGYLDIFKRDDPTFRIADYQAEKGIVEQLFVGEENEKNRVDIAGMIYLLYKGTAEVLFNTVLHFTKFDYRNSQFEKINIQDYEVLKDPRYAVLRKQLSTLQGLVSKQTIRSASDVVTHLRKYVSVEDFIGLMGCIEALEADESVKYVRITNKKYKMFLSYYLESIKH
jgi:hypothetical protein